MRLLITALSAVLAWAPSARAVDEIQVQALFTNKAMVTLDGKQRLLKAGKPSPEGVLLISSDSERAILEIDGQRGEYGLGTRISSQYKQAEALVAVQLWPDRQGMYSTVGSINGYPVTFLVDTGANTIAMNANEAKRLGIDYLVTGQHGLASTASGVVKSYGIKLRRVKVGELELTDVRGTVIDGNYPADVLLGMSFLQRLDMRREGKMMELKKKY